MASLLDRYITELQESGEIAVHGCTLAELVQIVSALGISIDDVRILETYHGARLKIG